MPAARFLAMRLAEDRLDSPMAPHADVLHPPLAAHAVQLYERESFLADVLARYVGSGLGAGDAAVVIATPSHRETLEELLEQRAFDVPTLRRDGRLVLLDARTTLDQLLVSGTVDAERFASTLRPVLTAANRAAPPGSVRVFDEMGVLLQAEDRTEPGLVLEHLRPTLSR